MIQGFGGDNFNLEWDWNGNLADTPRQSRGEKSNPHAGNRSEKETDYFTR